MAVERELRRRWAIEKKVGAGFGVALALLLILGLVSYQTALKLAQTERDDTPIDLALDKLDDISAQLKEAESGERGFLITGDEQYIQPYQMLSQTIDRDIGDLRSLAGNNTVFRQKIDSMAPLIASEMAAISQVYDIGGRAAVQPKVQAAMVQQSQRSMDEIFQVIGELEDEENQLLQQKTDETAAKDQAVNLSITGGSFLAILLAALMINRDMIERRRADAALRESAARFRRLAQNALDMIYRYRLKPAPGFEYVSPAALAITGYAPQDFYADPELGYKLVHPEDQSLIEILRHPTAAAAPLTVRWMHKNGTVTWTSQQLVPIYDPDGSLVAIEGIVRDVTDRMQAYQLLERRVEERTHEIERRRQVAEGLRDIMAILNSNCSLDEILDLIVAQACRLLGTDAGAVYHLREQHGLLCTQVARGLDADDAAINLPVGWSVVTLAIVNRRAAVVSDMSVADAEEADSALEPDQRAQLAALVSRYKSLLVVPLVIKDDIYRMIVLYYRDPREFTREEMALAVAFGDQAALAIENARLRIQAEQIAVAAERSRLARDLHDAVTQTLFSTSLIAEVLPRLWERDRSEAWRRLEELRQLTRGALAEMRTLLLELRPAALAEVGVAELLRQLTEAITSRARVPIALTFDGQCHLPYDVKIAVYRIAQEALNNMARHANASKAAVHLLCQPDGVELRIDDDGQGFDPDCVALEHLGLSIMRERAASIGAGLRIESRPGHGTHVSIVWSHVHAADDACVYA